MMRKNLDAQPAVLCSRREMWIVDPSEVKTRSSRWGGILEELGSEIAVIAFISVHTTSRVLFCSSWRIACVESADRSPRFIWTDMCQSM